MMMKEITQGVIALVIRAETTAESLRHISDKKFASDQVADFYKKQADSLTEAAKEVREQWGL